MKAYALSDTGLVRELNEDTVQVCEGKHMLCILADGMGGHRAGEVASALAAKKVADMLSGKQPMPADMMQAVLSANRAVYAQQKDNPDQQGMGTTLTALWEDEDSVVIGHVGDSRAYLYRTGRLHQMTEDHSMVGEMLREGLITQDEARSHPYRNVITQAVGTDETVKPDVLRTIKMPGDKWLLCSDGLSDMVEDSEIARVIGQYSAREAAQVLLSMALKNGGRDNVSVILLEVGA